MQLAPKKVDGFMGPGATGFNLMRAQGDRSRAKIGPARTKRILC